MLSTDKACDPSGTGLNHDDDQAMARSPSCSGVVLTILGSGGGWVSEESVRNQTSEYPRSEVLGCIQTLMDSHCVEVGTVNGSVHFRLKSTGEPAGPAVDSHPLEEKTLKTALDP